jgi:hypothetical protein
MWSVRERLRADRRDQAITGAWAGILLAMFLACVILPWAFLRFSNIATIVAALAAMGIWHELGLPPSGGPITVFSRAMVMGMNGLLIVFAVARLLGWGS